MGSALEAGARAIEYPESDGKPMAETDVHRDVMVDLIYRLKSRYAEAADVYVSGNLLVYYEEGNPKKSLAPDCFVAFGVPPGDRRIFKTWEEARFPEVVFEITSRKTRREDQGTKFTVYESIWKVKELFLFDPTEDYLDPSLIGYRLSQGRFKPIKAVGGRVASKELGITLERDGKRLKVRDSATGHTVLTQTEAAAETRLERMEAELARLQKELDSLRKRQSS